MVMNLSVLAVFLAVILSADASDQIIRRAQCIKNLTGVEIEDVAASAKDTEMHTTYISKTPVDDLKYGEYMMHFEFSKNSTFDFHGFFVRVVHMRGVANEKDCGGDGAFNNFYIIRIGHPNNKLCEEIKIDFLLRYVVRGCYGISVLPVVAVDNFILNEVPLKRHLIWFENDLLLSDFYLPMPPLPYIINKHPYLEMQFIFNEKSMHDMQLDSTTRLTNVKNVSVDLRCNLTAGGTVNCISKDLPSGFYSLILQFTDDWRCKSNIYICYFKTNISNEFSIPDPSDHKIIKKDDNEDSQSIAMFYFVIAASVILFLLVIIVILYFKIKRAKSREQDCAKADGESLRLNEIEEIYLIYARDCEPFMRLMAEFRTVLSAMTGCKVFDIFDDEEWFNRISTSTADFVNELHRERRKIILVTSKCAEILYHGTYGHHFDENADDGSPFIATYSKPHSWDGLLVFLLKDIMIDVSPRLYTKYFVVRIPYGISSFDTSDLPINPFTRFEIPAALDDLVDSVLRQTSNTRNPNYSLGDKDNFTAELKDLCAYVQKNPNYLMEKVLNKKVYTN